MLPKVLPSYLQERRGINAVAQAATQMGLIWRETGTGDVGVDGQLEFVSEDGYATGQQVAVQVKSGVSYFSNEDVENWIIYPENKHREYWEMHPLPVILVLHNSSTGISYWSDVRQALRQPSAQQSKSLKVPKHRVLQRATAVEVFETAGIACEAFIQDIPSLLAELITREAPSASFQVSYFDLFTLGLTNIARSLYFGMDLAMNAAESRDSEFGIGVGHDEHEFLFGFVKFLVSQNLANVPYSDCLIDWHEREMQPHFVAPLTGRGRALVRYIQDVEAQFVASGAMAGGDGVHAAQEGLFRMEPMSYFRRIHRIQAFQVAMASRLLK